MLDGDRLAGGLLDALVHDAEAAACAQWSAKKNDYSVREGSQLTSKLLKHLVATCDTVVRHFFFFTLDLALSSSSETASNDA